MKTLIGIPCMDMCHTAFMQSLLEMRKPGEVEYCIPCSSLVYDARNEIAQRAVDGDFDYVLWLDSDMMFEPEFMEQLLADLTDGREMVTAVAFKRITPFTPCIYRACGVSVGEDGRKAAEAVGFRNYPKDSVFEVAACGFACVMMTTDFLRRIMGRFGRWPFSPVTGFGEDMSFCLRAKEAGGTIWADSRPYIGHVGTFVYSRDNCNNLEG